MHLVLVANTAELYHEECEHRLAHIEAVSPVVVGNPSIAFTDWVDKSHQYLGTDEYTTYLLNQAVWVMKHF